MNEVTFDVVEDGLTISIFGRSFDDIVVIRGPEGATGFDDDARLYLYSRAHGLVGFSTDDLRATYWLRGEVGFGAQPLHSEDGVNAPALPGSRRKSGDGGEH